MSITRPFLKWPGGKFRLIPTLQRFLPKRAYLIEPFVGAGALFLNMPHDHLVLNDLNADLISLYRHLQKSGKKLVADAKPFFTPKYNRKIMYYRLRNRFNHTSDSWERALLFLYLNRHGYNGLCRYNLKGGYNVPFGEYKQPYFPEAEMLYFRKRIQQAVFSCDDYAVLLDRWCQHPDVSRSIIYCDPPYTPLSKTANFTSYAGQRFTQEDQKKLAYYAQKLAKQGAIIVISNHDTAFIREIYQEAQLHTINVTRSISCRGHSRQKTAEIIACFEC
jgi:DNA adenine methylase